MRYSGPIDDFDSLGQFKVHVLKVALRGQIGGAFYFLVNGYEVELIYPSMPKNLGTSTNLKARQMRCGFMTEIENMIAALSITEISEFLGVELLGSVPEITIMEGRGVKAYLEAEMYVNKTAFHVTAMFSGVIVEIAPYFIWMLDNKFTETLKLNIVT